MQHFCVLFSSSDCMIFVLPSDLYLFKGELDLVFEINKKRFRGKINLLVKITLKLKSFLGLFNCNNNNN